MPTQGGITKTSGILLIQNEVTPGTDPGAWSIATHGVVAYEVTFNPLDQANVMERAPLAGDGFIGVQTPIPGIRSSRLTVKCPLVPSGNNTSVATLKPDWEPLAIACGLIRGTDVAGPPAQRKYRSGNPGAGSTLAMRLYLGPATDMAGGSNWITFQSNGMAGNAKVTGGSNGDAALIEFDLQGSYVEPVASTDPGDPTLVEVAPPSFLSIGCTWFPNGLSSHVPRVKSFELDLGNEVVQRTDLNTASGIVAFIVTRQKPKVSMQVSAEIPAATVPNYYKDWTGARYGVLNVGPVGGGSNGRTHEWNFNRAQVETVGDAEADGVAALDVTWACAQDIGALNTPAVDLILT